MKHKSLFTQGIRLVIFPQVCTAMLLEAGPGRNCQVLSVFLALNCQIIIQYILITAFLHSAGWLLSIRSDSFSCSLQSNRGTMELMWSLAVLTVHIANGFWHHLLSSTEQQLLPHNHNFYFR